MSVNMGTNGLLIVPAGSTRPLGFHASSGLTHVARNHPEPSPTGRLRRHWHHQRSGRLPRNHCRRVQQLPQPGHQSGQRPRAPGNGNANLGSGALTVNDAASAISGGSLSAATQFVGSGGTGSLNQTAGTNTITSNLYLGYNSADSGSYSFNGTGKLSAGYPNTSAITARASSPSPAESTARQLPSCWVPTPAAAGLTT